jgi:hypothetical protein
MILRLQPPFFCVFQGLGKMEPLWTFYVYHSIYLTPILGENRGNNTCTRVQDGKYTRGKIRQPPSQQAMHTAPDYVVIPNLFNNNLNKPFIKVLNL